jgi:hypothetical protein
MTQYVINIGAIPNDGTGDPLRTAFNDVNLNFDQVWATGLVGSNITIANNAILTTNTNGNLILNPNGVGVVVANAHVIPDQNRIRNLGSGAKNWDTVYAWYGQFGGDISIGGNLTVTGNVIELGNVTTDSKTIHLSNSSSTSSAANLSGIVVGANSNIASFLYNATTNSWTTNLAITYSNGAPIGDSANIGQTPPPFGNGNLWYNSDDGRGYIKYNDQWIEFCPPIIPNPATYLGNLTIDGVDNSTLYFPPGGEIVFGDDTVQTTAYTGSGGGATDWANIGNINNQYGPNSIAIGQYAQTPAAYSVPQSFNGSTWTGTQFVAVGSDQNGNFVSATSPDGVTWTNHFTTISFTGQGVVYNGTNQYVAVGTNFEYPFNYFILTSPDAINWTQQTTAPGVLIGITYNGLGQYVAVGSDLTNSSIILTSPDGVTWTPQATITSVYFNSITWNGVDQYVAVGGIYIDPSPNYYYASIYTSPDGVTWTAQQEETYSYALNTVIWDPVHAQYVGVGTDNINLNALILTSSDGITWTQQAAAQYRTDGNFNGLAVDGAGNYIATGVASGQVLILSSTDGGVTWVRQANGLTTLTANSAACDPSTDLFVTVGSGILKSIGLSSWSIVAYQAGFNNIAIGQQAGANNQQNYSLAIGSSAGANFQGYSAIAIGSGAAYSNQGQYAVAIGEGSGSQNQKDYATAVGFGAGGQSQGFNATAIGTYAGSYYQKDSAIAIGSNAGNYNQGVNAVAIGLAAGENSQGNNSIAIGTGAGENSQPANTIILNATGNKLNGVANQTDSFYVAPVRNDTGNVTNALYYNTATFELTYGPAGAGGATDWANIGNINNQYGPQQIAIGQDAGEINQGTYAVAIGAAAGYQNQGQTAVAIGIQAGSANQGQNSVAIGYDSGQESQGNSAVAIGDNAGYGTQQVGAVAIGLTAGQTNQGQNAVAIGSRAGNASQQTQSVAIGVDAAADSQGQNSVAIGPSAAANTQGQKAVAIGLYAGNTSQGDSAVAIGDNAGSNVQGGNTVAVGYYAGNNTQHEAAIAIGQFAGQDNQGNSAVGLGKWAGQEGQHEYAVAVGTAAGAFSQGNSAVAIGDNSGHTGQKSLAIAIGQQAGYFLQGANAVAIGAHAGDDHQGNNSIIINATGNIVDQRTDNTFTVAPVRNDTSNVTNALYYNTATFEISYGPSGAPSGNSGAVQINWQGTFSNQGGTPGDTYSTLQFDSNGMPTLNGTTAYQQRVDYSPYLQVLTPRVESTDFGIVAGPGVTVVGYDDTYNTPRSAYLSVQDQATATQQWDFGILGNGSNNYSISDRTNGNTWTFGTDGNVTVPGAIRTASNSQLELTESANTAYLGTTADDSTALYLTATTAQLYANGEVSISSNVGGGNAYGWAFDVDGNTNIPGDIISFGNIGITTNVGNTTSSWTFDDNGNLTLPRGGKLLVSGGIVGGGASPAPSLSGFSTLQAYGNITGGNILTGGYLSVAGNITLTGGDIISFGNIAITTNVGNTTSSWTFDDNGNLTLPGNSSSINYANGQPYGSPVIVTATATGTQTINDASSAQVLAWTEVSDTSSAFAANIFTAPSNGFYQVNLSLYWGSGVTQTAGFVAAGINPTGAFTTILLLNGSASTGAIQTVSRLIQLTAGDELEFVCAQTTGSGQTPDPTGTTLSIYRIG